MKLLIVGANGQLGTELCRRQWPTAYRIAAIALPQFDISRSDTASEVVASERPDVVINAAAYTAVDRAESEAAAAWAANCEGPMRLAAACRKAKIPLIHISTDYVYDGTKPEAYRETDPVSPLGVYGHSKAAGDWVVCDTLAEHVILRTAWMYSSHGTNFVRTMLRLGDQRQSLRVVADQHGSPTSARDVASAIATILSRVEANSVRWGIYNFAGAGTVTWHGFAEAIFALAAPWRGAPPSVAAITTADYPTAARRPPYSELDCALIHETFGITPRPWRESLADVIAELYSDAALQPSQPK